MQMVSMSPEVHRLTIQFLTWQKGARLIASYFPCYVEEWARIRLPWLFLPSSVILKQEKLPSPGWESYERDGYLAGFEAEKTAYLTLRQHWGISLLY
jgi:hypothetical protein